MLDWRLTGSRAPSAFNLQLLKTIRIAVDCRSGAHYPHPGLHPSFRRAAVPTGPGQWKPCLDPFSTNFQLLPGSACKPQHIDDANGLPLVDVLSAQLGRLIRQNHRVVCLVAQLRTSTEDCWVFSTCFYKAKPLSIQTTHDVDPVDDGWTTCCRGMQSNFNFYRQLLCLTGTSAYPHCHQASLQHLLI